MTREELYAQWRSCQLCELCEERSQIVMGYGAENAGIMVISDKPGHVEDQTGIPMTGPAGTYYKATLEKLGIEFDEVWTTNCVACKTPDNRDPFIPELDACKERLYAEIRMVDPQVIVIMGKVTMKLLTGHSQAMGKVQKKTFLISIPGETEGVILQYPAIITYNPGFIRKNPSQKRGQPWHYFYEVLQMAADACRLLEDTYAGPRI